MEHKKIYDVAILGAGASGLMAAIAAAKTCPALSVAMLEKNEIPGRKLYVTGNGRCNVLNRTATSADYRSAEGDAAAFTAPALSSCGPERLTAPRRAVSSASDGATSVRSRCRRGRTVNS